MLTALTPHRHPARYIGLFLYRYRSLADIALTLLGPPSISRDGSPLKGVDSGKGLALLAYLSLESGRHSREELAALLWGDTPDHAARASLRQALKRLRTVLGDIIVIDRTHVTLGPGATCDAVAFLDAADSRPEEAAGFDVPHFLAGFSPRHAPAFDEWAAAKRQVLLQRYRQILSSLARDAMTRSQWRKAMAWADRWLTSDPMSEPAARLAIEALYLAGDRDGALARFAEFRDRLARETGSGPGAELNDLGRRIAADETTGRILEDPGPSPVPAFDPALVGREESWRKLGETWESIQRGAGRVVLVEGEPGIGKTRLVEEFLRWATAKGATAVRGRGYDAKLGIPFGPVVELLRAALEAPGLGGTAPEWLSEVAFFLLPELQQRFPGLPEPAPPSDANGERRLYEGVAQMVLALAAERPTVLFIDDLQWCDAKTCALLHFLARRLARARVALLTSVTLGDLEPDAPARRLCRALRSEPHAVPVTLSPLTEDDVWQLVHEMGRLRVPTAGRRLAARLREITEGNPFHLVELIKTLFAEGLLGVDADTGEWMVSRDGGGEGVHPLLMPRTVHAVIRERVTSLPYELRDLLATIAVAGRGVKTDLLSHVHGMSRLRAAALSDSLVERRLLIQEPGVYRVHPVVGEVVRESLTPARRAEVHRAIALSLETTTPPEALEEVAGEISRHAARGGERAMAYRFAVLSSEAAARQYAYEDALSWLDLAASVAQAGGETETVNHLTAEVLRLAGWTEPRRVRRPGTPARGIGRADIDLAGIREEGQSRL